MRIIAGKFGGRRLVRPKGDLPVRPTGDRVKESVFSILREQVIDATFLDMCAGTGNIGIEALSRGAKQVAFLERHPACVQLIERNLQRCGVAVAAPQVRLIRQDVWKGIATLHKRSENFELIYFDPPYNAGLYEKCLEQIAETRLLQTTGTLLVEHHKSTGLPDTVGYLTRTRLKQYGDTHLTFYYAAEQL